MGAAEILAAVGLSVRAKVDKLRFKARLSLLGVISEERALAISEATLAAVKQAYQIWAESKGDDVSGILGLMADDVDVSTLPDGAEPLTFTKACHDKVEMTEYLQALIGDWSLLRADIVEMVTERDVVVVLLTTVWKNRRTDKQFASPAAHVWRFRDGFAYQIRLFFDSAKWSDAASDAPGR
jgi:ketosteroid isomerase-like protein